MIFFNSQVFVKDEKDWRFELETIVKRCIQLEKEISYKQFLPEYSKIFQGGAERKKRLYDRQLSLCLNRSSMNY